MPEPQALDSSLTESRLNIPADSGKILHFGQYPKLFQTLSDRHEV
jgi:hypothetical protein